MTPTMGAGAFDVPLYAVEPGGGERPAAPAPLGLFFLGYVVIGTFGAVVGLVV